jgi:hypothetical protein
MPILASDAPLFPVPLHLIRHVEDPISNASAELDEYCTGNKIITIRGGRTVIVDYERQEILEIDRDNATYSVASFEDAAKARALFDPPAPKRTAIATASAPWKTTSLGVTQSKASRSADAFEVGDGNVKIEVAVDRQVTLSRDALDAITGSGYPNKTTPQQEAVARACARTDAVSARTVGPTVYGLPLEQSTTVQVDAKHALTIRNSILRVSNELPPPELLAIPAGAKLVESRAAQMQRTLKELGDATAASKP